MDVIDHHHEGIAPGQGLEELSNRPEGLLGYGMGVGQPDHLGQPLLDEGAVALVVQEPPELRSRLDRDVGLTDPGSLSDHFGHRPEGDALAVGQAPAPEDRGLSR